MKRDSFAFPDASPDYSAKSGSDGRTTLTVGPIEKGLWYVTVRCATTVDSKEVVTNPSSGKGRSFVYSGSTGVLNGVPYSIMAEWKY